MKIVISKSRLKQWWNREETKKHICHDCRHFHRYFAGAGYCSKDTKDWSKIKNCPKVLLEDSCGYYERNKPMCMSCKHWEFKNSNANGGWDLGNCKKHNRITGMAEGNDSCEEFKLK